MEINYTENGKTIEKINKTKSWYYEKTKKTDKSLARHTLKKKKKKERRVYTIF